MAKLLKLFQQEFDNSGNPNVGGTITVYNHGTLDLADIYSSSDLETPIPNPVTLGSSGRVSIYVGDGFFDAVLKDSSGNTLDQDTGIAGDVGFGSGTVSTVGTINELMGLASGVSAYVDVTGYYTAGDGKSFSRYYWSATSTATHNGGTVVKPYSDPATGRWLAVIDGIVNVYQFGARGDGTSDDYAAINNAKNWAIANGKSEIYLPEGTFGISQAIDLSKENWPSEKNGAKGFFKIRGSGKRTRIKPLANIDYCIKSIQLSANNDLNGGAGASTRRLTIEDLTIYSDNSLNSGAGFSFTEGIRFNWVADVYIRNVDVSNAVTKSALAFDSCFPIEIDNCNLYGEAANFTDATRDTPDAIELIRAYTASPPSPSVDLCGVRFTGICTTTWMKNCRVSNFINGVCVGGMEMLSIQNCAIESNKSNVNGSGLTDGRGHGILVVDGAVTIINIKHLYPEGNECTFGVKATFQGGSFTNSYFHDSVCFRFYSGYEVTGLNIHDNHMRGMSKLIDDQGAKLINFQFYNNDIFVDRYYKDTFFNLPTDYTTLVNRNKISFRNNFFRVINSNDHIPILNRDTTNLASYPISGWQLNGDATLTIDDDRYLNNDTYRLTSTVSGSISRNIIPSLNNLDDRGVRGSWFTMGVPVCKIGTPGDIKFTVRYKNSGTGDSLAITGRADIKSTSVTFIQTTHLFSFDGGVGTFVYDETISWTGGTGVITGYEGTTTGAIFFRLTSGVIPTDNQTIAGGTSSAVAYVNGTTSALSGLVAVSGDSAYNAYTKVRFTNSGGALPTGLTAGTSYYISRMSDGRSLLATSVEDADSDVVIAYTDAGTGTHTIYQYNYWVMNYIYFRVPEDAEYLRVTINPQVGTYIVAQPTIYKGLWGDEMGQVVPDELITIRPLVEQVDLLNAYDGPNNPNKKTITMRNDGTPSYGIIEVKNNDVVAATMHGTRGFVTDKDRNYIVGNASREMALYNNDAIKARISPDGLGIGDTGPTIIKGSGDPNTGRTFTASLSGTQTFTASDSSGSLLLTYASDITNYERLRVTTTGTLPTGLTAGTDYYVIRVSATTCKLATSYANAVAGTAIAYTDTGSGTHTMVGSLLLTYTGDITNWHRLRVSTTGTLPTGLSAGTDYYVIRRSSTTCMLATSLSNAQSNLSIVYTDAGTGTHTLNLYHQQGSLYLRTDGSSTSTRAYINTGGTTWTNLTTAA